MSQKKLLIVSTGGDCPGINAVIRAIVKSAREHDEWTLLGSEEGHKGLMADPPVLLPLNPSNVAGIHVKGGTILKTTNQADPLAWPTRQSNGSILPQDITPQLAARMKALEIDATVAIGGDGTQRVSLALAKHAINVVGIPKTIDNDLSATSYTFGFQTAVQTAVDAFDKLVTTAESHNRTMIMEVMGRDTGWIALHTAIAGGAEVCLIPEIPYTLQSVRAAIERRYQNGRGFANVVIAEGAKPIEPTKDPSSHRSVAYELAEQLKDLGLQADLRETVLGHIQRGGSPIAFDRVLATQFGVKAFDMIQEGRFGRMVSLVGDSVEDVSLEEAVSSYRHIDTNNYLVEVAHKIGISFGAPTT